MLDPRVQKLAQVIVHYSLGIKSGDKFLIQGSDITAPLIKEVYREGVRAGAHVMTRVSLEGLSEILLREGSDEQLSYLPPAQVQELELTTAFLSILGAHNTKSRSGIDPARMALQGKAFAKVNERYLERSASGELRWCVTLFPTQANAQDAEMSLEEYERFVYDACLLNEPDPVAAWQAVKVSQQRIIDFLSQHDEIHIVAPGTDITYHVGGRTWLNACGDSNFPDGEVFTGPIEDSVNGTVTYTHPAIYAGKEVEGVHLTFRDGRVIEATAARGQALQDSMHDMDEGARTLGEVAFGLNYGVKRFSRNILFDEKIGGTMHMALGAAFPETGATNDSALHWDMICDLRQGQVFADGQLCYEGGQFKLA